MKLSITCPFCNEILPDLISDQMKLALDRINNKQGKISELDWMDFCFIYFTELSIIPNNITNKYFFIINFNELSHHINRFKDDLTEIINGNTYSYYFSFTKQPGYYGTKGVLLIANILIDLFITTNILTPVNSYPLQIANYIQKVFIPKIAMRLIFEDIGDNSSLEIT
ncbi:hypothetical protein RhiirA4_479108 [Rhizophagus irregularis]|uniref:Restriction of telomere capping protein 4 n=1 Tax=Rhizophagus irregularis TaxID=588596 RepID=A0A2I1HFX2_9GLOM|nr:hypothetical protein RhiirA4_479108 [Rhizophagus irregularis]